MEELISFVVGLAVGLGLPYLKRLRRIPAEISYSPYWNTLNKGRTMTAYQKHKNRPR